MIRRVFVAVVLPIVFGYLVGACLTGCGSTFAELEEAANDGSVPAKLRICRAEARTAIYVEQKSDDEAYARYVACKKREGL